MLPMILIGAMIMLFILSSYMKKKADENELQTLYQVRIHQSQDAFFEQVDKSAYSKFTRFFMKINYLTEHEKWQEAEKILKAFDPSRLSGQNFSAYYEKAFEIAVQTRDDKAAKAALEQLEARAVPELITEMQDIYAVYFHPDKKLINKYEALIKDEKYDIRKAEYYFRLAKLYHYFGENQMVHDCLEKSKQTVHSEVWHKKMDDFMNHYNLLR